jgi:hypothetical protein
MRNRYELIRGEGIARQFFRGKENLIRHTMSAPGARWSLIASGGERSFIHGVKLPEPFPKMMNIWRIENWDTLYKSMYTYGDAGWFDSLVKTLLSEDQDLLVDLGAYPTTPRGPWPDDRSADRVYLYEEVLLNPDATGHAFLRNFCWFASQVETYGWRLTWNAQQITSAPSALCALWSVPTVDRMNDTLERMANETPYAHRYAKMMGQIATLSRQVLCPSWVERLDDRIRAGQPAPIVP